MSRHTAHISDLCAKQINEALSEVEDWDTLPKFDTADELFEALDSDGMGDSN